jgi:hypothetical protein
MAQRSIWGDPFLRINRQQLFQQFHEFVPGETKIELTLIHFLSYTILFPDIKSFARLDSMQQPNNARS